MAPRHGARLLALPVLARISRVPLRRSLARLLPTAALCALAVPASEAGAGYGLRAIGTFSEPVYVTGAPGDTRRVFVVERRGRVVVLRGGKRLRRPFADLRRQVLVRSREETRDQRGLLSIAFAPDYGRSGLLYAFYVDRRDRIVVDELRRARGTADRIAPSSRRRVLDVGPAGPFHHGGQLQFGPDGLLYVAVGFADVAGRGQDLGSLYGKILRIDPRPSAGAAYRIPPGNPFAARTGARPEIFVLGLRNPWRFSFDRATGDLVIGDVGEAAAEEIDVLPRGEQAGANLGWDRAEGAHVRGELPPGYRAPVLSFDQGRASGGWCSIVGGYVVRDPRIPELRGSYLFSDLCHGRVHAARLGAAPVRARALRLRVPYLASFGEDTLRRVYAVSFDGPVFRLGPR